MSITKEREDQEYKEVVLFPEEEDGLEGDTEKAECQNKDPGGITDLISAILDAHREEEIREEDRDVNFALPEANIGDDSDRYTLADEDRLVRENRGLIEWVAGTFAQPCGAMEKSTEQICYSAAYFGFLKAIRSYHLSYAESGGCSFSTWATVCMQNQIRSELRQHTRQAWRMDSMETVVNDKCSDSISSTTLGETIESDLNVEEDVIKKIKIRSMLSAIEMLDPKEKDMITLLFGINCEKITQDQLALKYAVSQATIAKNKRNILRKLRFIMMSTFGITSAT